MRGRASELRHHAGDLRQDVGQRWPGDPGDQNVARRDPRQLAFAIDHHGAAGAPADAGRMAGELGMGEPDLVGHQRRLHVQRPRLQELEARLVERPFDLDRRLQQILAFAQLAAEFGGLPGRQARLDGVLLRHRERRDLAVAAGVAVVLAAGLDGAHETLSAEHDAVRHHLALCDRGAEPPGRTDQHVAFGGFAQTATRRSRGDQRLNQHRHRGRGRVEAIVRHVATRIEIGRASCRERV